MQAKVTLKPVTAYTVSMNGTELGEFTEHARMAGMVELRGPGGSIVIDEGSPANVSFSRSFAEIFGTSAEVLLVKASPEILAKLAATQKEGLL